MSLFGSSAFGTNRNTSVFGSSATTATNAANPLNDVEVPQTPDDTVQALKFNKMVQGQPVFLAAGGWDNTVRVWQVGDTGACEAKAMQNVGAPVLAIDWFDDSSKIFIVSADKQARVWDLASNQLAVVGTHDAPIASCHWINSSSYSCLMTGGYDKTLRFWDMRQLPTQNSLATVQLPERVFCSDVIFPMAAVALGNRHVKLYNLENSPTEVKDIESPLKYQSRCISIFRNKTNNQPTGFALGSIEGRVAIQYAEPTNPKDNFTFKCHRSQDVAPGQYQEIFAVNDLAFHPQHGTMATCGSDGRFSYWDKDQRIKLKTFDALPNAITKCCIHDSGMMFAYAVGYDWSKGHEYHNTNSAGSKVFLHACNEEMKPRAKK
ncbi:hypothetical protein QR680_009209 [Steinernema hermaphroditum]|uniref:Ig-like domain-containing protein n=1 Tax=Steinernema hermaphroditum TaxID=289476 RepID=A0AA39M9H4_9BILA|nr:hypothetical protein QR680_009209 [Steinernema hermaphroditum]